MTTTVKSDAQLRFDKTLEVLALVWAETIKRLSATQAQRDHERAENAHLWRVYETATVYRAKVDYTGGDSPPYFRDEQDELDKALAAVPPRGEKGEHK